MFLSEIITIHVVLQYVLQITLSEEIIAYISEEDDEESLDIYRHLTVSQKFHSHDLKMQNITMKHIIIRNAISLNDVCERIEDVSIVISACKSENGQQLVMNMSQSSGIPTVHLFQSSWNVLLENNTEEASKNQIFLIPTATVFDNVILDIMPSLNLSRNVSVLFDPTYGNLENIRKVFGMLPVSVNFFQLHTTPNKLREQLMYVAGIGRVIIIAKTANTVMVVKEYSRAVKGASNLIVLTKDTTPFQCMECSHVDLFWIRPYATGNPNTNDLRKFLINTDSGSKLNYTFTSWEEIDVAFYFNVMEFVSKLLSDTRNRLKYTCFSSQPNTPFVFEDASVELTRLVPEYGIFKEYSASVHYPDVQAKVFRIVHDTSKETYNKQIASWTITEKVKLLYGRIDVDVKTTTEYRVVTVQQPPFIQLSGNPEKPYEGFCVDLLEEISEELNFTYTLYEVEDGMFGTLDQAGNWNGVIGALVSGSADIALASLSMTAEREIAVDFTIPYYKLVGVAILMKKPELKYSLFSFMQVLEWPVWLCIAAAYFLTSITLSLFDRFSPYSYTNYKRRFHNAKEMRVFSFKECLWFCMTSLTPQGGGEAPKNISGRVVAATWWLFGFITMSSYTANLSAFLTVSRLEQSISSLEDLANQHKVKYAPIRGGAIEVYFESMANVEEKIYNTWRDMAMNESRSQFGVQPSIWDYPVADKFTKMWRSMQNSKFPKNMSEAINLVLNSVEGFAVMGDAAEIRYEVLTNCQLQQVGTEFGRRPYAIATQKGHILKDRLNTAIMNLTNRGRLQFLEEKWFNDNPKKVVDTPSCEVGIKYGTRKKAISFFEQMGPDNGEVPRKFCIHYRKSFETYVMFIGDLTYELVIKVICAERKVKNGMAIHNIGGVFYIILAAIVLSALILAIEYTYHRKNNTRIDGHQDVGGIKRTNGTSVSYASCKQ